MYSIRIALFVIRLWVPTITASKSYATLFFEPPGLAGEDQACVSEVADSRLSHGTGGAMAPPDDRHRAYVCAEAEGVCPGCRPSTRLLSSPISRLLNVVGVVCTCYLPGEFETFTPDDIRQLQARRLSSPRNKYIRRG
jgi:hypothetical protein